MIYLFIFIDSNITKLQNINKKKYYQAYYKSKIDFSGSKVQYQVQLIRLNDIIQNKIR